MFRPFKSLQLILSIQLLTSQAERRSITPKIFEGLLNQSLSLITRYSLIAANFCSSDYFADYNNKEEIHNFDVFQTQNTISVHKETFFDSRIIVSNATKHTYLIRLN